MYHDSNSARITERVENAKLVNELSEEKNKWEKKYSDMVEGVNKFLDDTYRVGRLANYEKIQQERRNDDMKTGTEHDCTKTGPFRSLPFAPRNFDGSVVM